MANDRQSVFVPLQAQDLEGPFSGSLRPPEQQQTQMPPGALSTGGGIAMAANAFLQGATQARIKAFENRENAKLQKLNQLNSYVTRTFPTLTPEGQQKMQELYNRALGPEVLTAMEGGGKKGKKGGGDGEQQDGAHHHFMNILKDVALGMAGGKMPKGAPEVDLHSVIGNMAIIASDPKYSREGVMTGAEGEIKKALEGYEGYREGAMKLAAPHLQAIARLDSQRAATAEATFLGGYQNAPAPGSPADIAARASQITPSGSAPPPDAVRTAAPTSNATPMAGFTPVGGGAAPPQPVSSQQKPSMGFTGRALSGDQMWTLQEGKRVRPGDDWQINGQRIRGNIIDLGTGPAFFDQSGREMNVDVSQLTPFTGRQAVNIVNPKDQNDTRSMLRDKDTGILYDHDGIPAPKDMQGWQEGTGYYRPTADRHVYNNAQGHPVFMRANGSTYVGTDTVYHAPDHWAQRFQFQEGHEIRTAMRQAEAQYTAEKSRIKRTWDARIGSIDKDYPTLKPKEKEAKKAELQQQRKDELDGLEQDHRAMNDALGDIYASDDDNAPPNPVKKKKTTKTDGDDKGGLSAAAQSLLP